jgi:hypothetical protein
MYYDLVKAKYVKDFQISVEFSDGSKGIADLKKIIDKGGVFAELKTLENFKNFFIHPELKVLTWQNEIDIAPETLYALAIEENISA